MNDQTALATLENISDLTDGRDKAIALWLDTYDHFHATTQLAGAASIGGRITLSAPHGDRYSDETVTRAFIAFGQVERYDRESGRRSQVEARVEQVAAMLRAGIDDNVVTAVKRVNPDRAGKLADLMAAMQKDLKRIETALRVVAVQQELAA